MIQYRVVMRHKPGGTGVLNTLRITVIQDRSEIVIKNAFPSTSIGFQ